MLCGEAEEECAKNFGTYIDKMESQVYTCKPSVKTVSQQDQWLISPLHCYTLYFHVIPRI